MGEDAVDWLPLHDYDLKPKRQIRAKERQREERDNRNALGVVANRAVG